MSERLQIVLLLCLTSMGLTAVLGMVILEAEGRPIAGHLPSIATGALVALTGLVVVMGQSARQGRMESKLDNIHNDTNSAMQQVKADLEAATQEIKRLRTMPPH